MASIDFATHGVRERSADPSHRSDILIALLLAALSAGLMGFLLGLGAGLMF